jgi:uncharacterized membrane protein
MLGFLKKGFFEFKKRTDYTRLVLTTLSCLVSAYIILLSTLSILRHNAFASNFDLANMDQTVWNTLYGNFFSLTAGEQTVSRLSIHADFILILLSPLYLIWNDVRVLLISESVALALGALPVFFLSWKVLKSRIIALCMSLIYLLNPSMQWTDIYDFHGVAFAIPTLLAAFYFSYTKRWKLFLLFAFLAILTKEQISLFIAMLSLVIFFYYKKRLLGTLTFTFSVLWFFIMVFVVIPYFSPGGKHWALGWYSFSQIQDLNALIYVFREYISRLFFTPEIWNYYSLLLKPFGFLPILGFPWLLLSLPELSINILSSQAQMKSIYFHYDSGITPALLIGTIFGLSYLHFILKKLKLHGKIIKGILYLVVIYLLVVSIRVNYNYSPLPSSPSCWCLTYQVSQDDIEFEKVLRQIPENASVAASGNVRSHITHRNKAHALPGGVDSADYIAILTQERIIGGYNQIEYETNLVKRLQSSNTHQLIRNIGDFYLFRKL